MLVAANTAITSAMLCRGMGCRTLALGLVVAFVSAGPAWFVLGAAPGVGRTARVALVQPGRIDDAGARLAAGEALTATAATGT